MIKKSFDLKREMCALERISCINFVETGGYAYFSNRFYNGLYKVELETGKTVFLGYFENEKLYQGGLHKEIFLKDDKIYICPWKGRCVHILNLVDRTLQSVEIRKNDEEIFFIDEVVLGENSLFFMPDSKNFPIKKMDLESLEVTKISNRDEIHGRSMSKSKDIFPVPELIEKYHIEYPKHFFWKKVSGKGWYAFRFLGCHMLHYIEGWERLEIIPLSIVNKSEVNKYLHKVKMRLLNEILIKEDVVRIQVVLDHINVRKKCEMEGLKSNGNIGKMIWEYIKG